LYPLKLGQQVLKSRLILLVPKSQGAAIIAGGIIDIKIGFIISPLRQTIKKWYSQ
jgi:hypothetical protein